MGALLLPIIDDKEIYGVELIKPDMERGQLILDFGNINFKVHYDFEMDGKDHTFSLHLLTYGIPCGSTDKEIIKFKVCNIQSDWKRLIMDATEETLAQLIKEHRQKRGCECTMN